ncbi:MAG: amidohydrolase [Sediminibacterium sp.]|jgi:predicted amidohydrolase YtcJ
MARLLLLLFTFVLTLTFLSCGNKKTIADKIFFNARIYTGNEAQPFAEAMALRDNKIIAVGTSEEIKKLAGASTDTFNLQGKLVTPGFNDAHIHFLRGSLEMQTADLNRCKTPKDAADTVLAFAQRNAEADWITGSGWQYTIFPDSKPTKEILDAIIPDRPVFIYAYDGHSAWVNSKALELAGIDKNTPYSGFGSIVKDKNGKPTGMLSEGAMQLVRKLLPPITKENKLKAIQAGLQYAASLGITSLQNASGSIEELELYEELLLQKKLIVRYGAAFSANSKTSQEDIDRFTALKKKFSNNSLLRADAIKFILDGVIESHTAVMINDYSDAGEKGRTANGTFALPLEDYRRLTLAFDKAGFRLFTHAIGDQSVREALNAYEQCNKINGTQNSRHRIEHIEQCHPDDIKRFQQLHVLPSMQPIHADPATVAVWSKAVGQERLPYSFGWQSMLQSKATLVFGSDWPACINLDPIHGLHVAVNRQSPNGVPPGGWIPEQRISIQDAINAYTQGGAYSSFEENTKGKLQPGYYADFIVLSKNLFSIDPTEIHSAKVLLTVVDGNVVYTRKE